MGEGGRRPDGGLPPANRQFRIAVGAFCQPTGWRAYLLGNSAGHRANDENGTLTGTPFIGKSDKYRRF